MHARPRPKPFLQAWVILMGHYLPPLLGTGKYDEVTLDRAEVLLRCRLDLLVVGNWVNVVAGDL